MVIGGIAVHERTLHYLTVELDKVAGTFHEDPDFVELHASEIFRGKTSPWDKLNKRGDRITAIKKTLETINMARKNVSIFACAVHKNSFENRDPVEMAFEDLISRFDLFIDRIYQMEKSRNREPYPHRGIIVFDNHAYQSTLQRMTLEFRKSGTRWGNIRNIREVPFFVDSRSSRLIQLADHIAYSVSWVSGCLRLKQPEKLPE